MNKLTPAQRDWIVDLMDKADEEMGGHEAGWGFQTCIAIIKQCTEQELTHEEVLKWALAERLCKETNDTDSSSNHE